MSIEIFKPIHIDTPVRIIKIQVGQETTLDRVDDLLIHGLNQILGRHSIQKQDRDLIIEKYQSQDRDRQQILIEDQDRILEIYQNQNQNQDQGQCHVLEEHQSSEMNHCRE